MNRKLFYLATAVAVFAGMLSTWVEGEIFFQNDTIPAILSALMINLAAFFGLYALVSHYSEKWGLICVRWFICFGFLAVAAHAFHAHLPSWETRAPFLWGAAIISALILTFLFIIWADDELYDRIAGSILIATVALIIAPSVVAIGTDNHWVWIPAKPHSNRRPVKTAVVAILLDELGYSAALPLTKDLEGMELHVQYSPMASSGQNTINVIPRLFTGMDFSNAGPCGTASLCSGFNRFDFSRTKVGRGDVDLAGIYFPYCDIPGLRSCFTIPPPDFSFHNAYTDLLSVYLGPLGISIPASVLPPAPQYRTRLGEEMRFINSAPIWKNGGVLYAHIGLPHLPGLNGPSTVDADYEKNIEAARGLVRSLAGRLKATFGANFSLVIFADHGLRLPLWCSLYPKDRCQARPAYRDKRVPLIVAAPMEAPRYHLKSNAAIFSVLNAEIHRMLD